MFRYTAEILPYHDMSLEEALRDLADIGFKEVNLWSSAAPLAHHVNPGDDPGKIRDLLDKYGMKPSGLTVYGKNQDEILERVEFASQLGIDTVIFDCEANYPDFVGSFLPPIVEAGARAGVRIAVENHLTVPFSADFEAGGNEDKRWDEGVDTFAQIKRLVRDIDDPYLGVCLAPPHLWVMQETISEVITFLTERKRLFYYYIWDVDRGYRHGVDGLNFGPGEKQLPSPDGTLDHRFLLSELHRAGYQGAASLKCHGTHGWSLEKIGRELRASDAYVRDAYNALAK
ncbi:sugar phosphate isomerase/epimerase [Arthrobacter sp. B3I9]|uniref:sugar phosphate isomerase/epimerase family protein n=1 Tax=Arthrobacter sp. B3I9 TaxID=3042270 RepID=UPI002790B533|nr:TIM barrel protein [Arthrobacter sp. B3I9]MDQ0851704.1 sugar phosphate isomerase/epimerase [Arthrobacter sp. B3I9]